MPGAHSPQAMVARRAGGSLRAFPSCLPCPSCCPGPPSAAVSPAAPSRALRAGVPPWPPPHGPSAVAPPGGRAPTPGARGRGGAGRGGRAAAALRRRWRSGGDPAVAAGQHRRLWGDAARAPRPLWGDAGTMTDHEAELGAKGRRSTGNRRRGSGQGAAPKRPRSGRSSRAPCAGRLRVSLSFRFFVSVLIIALFSRRRKVWRCFTKVKPAGGARSGRTSPPGQPPLPWAPAAEGSPAPRSDPSPG